MTVVDRAFDQPIPPGAWDAVFVRATHDSSGLDTGFVAHWATLRTTNQVRGAYHFAHPGGSSGAAQGKLFCDRVISQGWNPKRDIWALDLEYYPETNLGPWVDEFMRYCIGKLGDRGFLYVGWPYFVTHVSHQDFSLLHRYRWWVPAYGPNDGHDHGSDPSWPVAPTLHQFTSNPFDQSSITDLREWQSLFIPEATVFAEFNPAIRVVSKCLFHHPTLGVCAADVQSDGSVFCTPGNAYLGGMNGSKDFKGRTAKRIVAFGQNGYTIIDATGETYHFEKR